MALDHLPVILSGTNLVRLPGGERLANWSVDFYPANGLYNASALRGTNLSTATPTVGQVLIYDGISYTPSTLIIPGSSITPTIGQTLTWNGSMWVGSSLVLPASANHLSPLWNASALVGYPLSSNMVPMDGGRLTFSSNVWTAMPTYGSSFPSGAPHGFPFTRPDLSSTGPFHFQRDAARNAWLATDSFELVATEYSAVNTGEYLSYPGGTKLGPSAGYHIPYDFVVVEAIMWQASGSVSSVTFRLRRNGSNISNVVISAGNSMQSNWTVNNLAPACLLNTDTYSVAVTLAVPTAGLGVKFKCKRIAH